MTDPYPKSDIKNISWLLDRLNGQGLPVIIDGGMGTELGKSGVPMDGSVWSCRANLSQPDAVRQTHEAFIDGRWMLRLGTRTYSCTTPTLVGSTN